ncbi:uncharacterized protein TNCV_3201061 [Trichonephila clavipes]|nr:uncharacterized protein TNCV_3201061 [Trichonephila clavipes]
MRCFPFETGIHYRRKSDFFSMPYSGFEPEPTRLQVEGHIHHTGWTATGVRYTSGKKEIMFFDYLANPNQNHSMPAMVSQNQENDWENGPSRTGSMLSLDGRQRPPTAKTPPSYYDAVRSRHSLSQPVNKSPESMKQEKSLHVQQVKYNSLPR